jgi:hypothetical protein
MPPRDSARLPKKGTHHSTTNWRSLQLCEQIAAILIMEIQGAKRSPQATVLPPEPLPVSADKARSFPK